jgi:S1-C subfamily serine protease
VLLLVLGAVLGFLVLDRFVGWRFWDKKPDLSSVPQREVVARGELAGDERATIDIYKNNAPSVVHINNMALRRSVFSFDVQQVQRGEGSGFVWNAENGLIVTNAHVVEGADRVQVILADQDRSAYETSMWVAYPDRDLAVLYVNAPKNKLHEIPKIGTSNDLQVGQKTFAIGNPFGLDQTLTTGIVSALNRDIKSESGRPIQGVIQTSAAINPGNSGGPLLDSEGRLIGVNTAILSPSGTFAGIGFAIPIDEIKEVVPTLIAKLNDAVRNNKDHEEVVPPRMGVVPASDQLAQALGVSEGALIRTVVRGSPAEKAGLRSTQLDPDTDRVRLGDIIVAIDGNPVKKWADVYKALQGHKAGDTITLTVLRNDKRVDVPVTLAAPRLNA